MPPSDPTPATIFSGLTYTWLHAGLGETTTNDNGADGYGGSNVVVDAVADQGPGGYNCAQTTTARPRLEDKGWDGQPSWAFNASSSHRIASDVTSFASQLSGEDTPFIIGGAFQCFTSASTQLPFSFGGNPGTHFLEIFMNATNFTVRKNAGANVDAPSGGGGTSNLNRHTYLIATNAAGTAVDVWIDGVQIATGAAFNAASITLNVFALNCLRRSTLTTFGDMRQRTFFAAVGATAITKTAECLDWLDTLIETDTTPMVVFCGDSHIHTANGETSMVSLTEAAFPGTVIVNNGVPGDTIQNVVTTKPTLTRRYTYSIPGASRSVRVYYLGYGANDLESGRLAAAVATDIQTQITAIRAADATGKIIVVTFFDNGSLTVGEQTERATLNTDINTNAVSVWGADAVHNRAGLLPEANTDLTYFDPDNKHLNATGEAILLSDRNGFSGLTTILSGFGLT